MLLKGNSQRMGKDKSKIKYSIRAGIIFLIIGIVMLISENIYIPRKNAITTNATIIQVSNIGISYSRYHMRYYKVLVVSYSDEYGNTYNYHERIYSTDKDYLRKNYFKNDEISIIYNKANPNRATTHKPGSYGLIILIGGILTILLSLLWLYTS